MRFRPRRLGLTCLVLLCLSLAGRGWAAELSVLLPEHIRVQIAGHSGLLSLGAGYGFWDGRVEPGLLYGVVPEAVGGRTVHLLSQRTTVAPIRLQPSPALFLYPILAGYSANIALGKNYRLFQEEKFWGYYWPSALHFWLFTGTRLGRNTSGPGPVKGVSAVMEIGTLYAYGMAYVQNDSIHLRDVLSLALALQVHIK